MMTREEAIEVYNGLINTKIKEAFEFFAPELRESEDKTKSAIDLIAEERERQISKGFNWKHDDEHDCHQLSDAAIVYAAPAPLRYQVMNWWPWDKKWLKEDDSFTTEGRIRELVKAGALIVAEIERLQRTINNASKPIESEEERIRRKMIEHFKSKTKETWCNMPVKDIIAYLEKQKEQLILVEEVLARAGLKPYKDGNQWCILAGDNIQEGICGFGDTIEDALYEFLKEVLDLQKEQKPAEWSDEDEKMLNDIIGTITYAWGETSDRVSLLKFLKNRGSSPKSNTNSHSWKPSKEQMEAFRSYIKDFQEKAEAAVGGWNNFDVMIRLYEQLKKLM